MKFSWLPTAAPALAPPPIAPPPNEDPANFKVINSAEEARQDELLLDLFGGNIISAYSREQAIEDGVLVDVSETAREAGITFPVAITRAVWDGYVTPDPRATCQSIAGRLWDTLWMLRFAIKRSRSADVIRYQLMYIMKEKQRRLVTLKAVCGPGDDAEPVITIMLPGED